MHRMRDEILGESLPVRQVTGPQILYYINYYQYLNLCLVNQEKNMVLYCVSFCFTLIEKVGSYHLKGSRIHCLDERLRNYTPVFKSKPHHLLPLPSLCLSSLMLKVSPQVTVRMKLVSILLALIPLLVTEEDSNKYLPFLSSLSYLS